MFFIRFELIAILFFASFAQAAPKDLSQFFEPVTGLVTLSDGSVVAGSHEFGGRTPDFLIDWHSKEFDEFCTSASKYKIYRVALAVLNV